jgi:hypothetical protein
MRYVPKLPDLLLCRPGNQYSFELINSLIFNIIGLYQGIIKSAEENEGGCIEFQLFTDVNAESGVEELFTIERMLMQSIINPTSFLWRCRKNSGLT